MSQISGLPGGGGGGGRAMRSLMKDSSVRHHKLTADTLRRILGFARPYRG